MNHDLLAFSARSFVDFEDGTYRWVDVKRFSVLRADACDETILRAVIGSPLYRDHYATPDSQSDTGKEHGPYLLDHISEGSFEECGSQGGIETMQSFNDIFGVPPSPAVEEALAALVFRPLATASTVFKLRRLEGAQHSFGWVIDEFRELIAISADKGEVILVVAAID